MFTFSKKKSGMCSFCEWMSVILTALATICSLAAVTGLYKAHVLSTGLAFGTSTGSLSIIALVLSLFLLKKSCEGCACEIKMAKKK